MEAKDAMRLSATEIKYAGFTLPKVLPPFDTKKKIAEIARIAATIGNIEVLKVLFNKKGIPSIDEHNSAVRDMEYHYRKEIPNHIGAGLADDRKKVLESLKASLEKGEKVTYKELKAKLTEIFDNFKSRFLEGYCKELKSINSAIFDDDFFKKLIDAQLAIDGNNLVKDIPDKAGPDIKRVIEGLLLKNKERVTEYQEGLNKCMDERTPIMDKVHHREEKIGDAFRKLVDSAMSEKESAQLPFQLSTTEITVKRQNMETGEFYDVSLAKPLQEEFEPLVDARLMPSDMSLADDAENTLLHIAVRNGHLELVKQLIKWGFNPKMPNSYGVKAVDYALLSENYSIIEALDPDKTALKEIHHLQSLAETFQRKVLPSLYEALNNYKMGCFTSPDRKIYLEGFHKSFDALRKHSVNEFILHAAMVDSVVNNIKHWSSEAHRGCFGRSTLFDPMEAILDGYNTMMLKERIAYIKSRCIEAIKCIRDERRVVAMVNPAESPVDVIYLPYFTPPKNIAQLNNTASYAHKTLLISNLSKSRDDSDIKSPREKGGSPIYQLACFLSKSVDISARSEATLVKP